MLEVSAKHVCMNATECEFYLCIWTVVHVGERGLAERKRCHTIEEGTMDSSPQEYTAAQSRFHRFQRAALLVATICFYC
jgi:hypothetical protein